jgi:TrmH family RNA methyltransferase
MNTITSITNEKVKAVRKLKDKKFRQKEGLFVVEGINILRDIPSSVDIDCFFVEEGIFSEVEGLISAKNAPVYVVSQEVFKSISETVSPSGLVAVVKTPDAKLCGGNLLVLDRVSDSGNLGTIIRTAAATSFLDILLINCADAYSGKVVRATMGGIFNVNILEVSEDEAVEAIKGRDSYALDMGGNSITSFKPATPVAIILGSEAHGVSERLLKAANNIASIPMQNGMESLNVAVAGAIAMYNLTIF